VFAHGHGRLNRYGRKGQEDENTNYNAQETLSTALHLYLSSLKIVFLYWVDHTPRKVSICLRPH